MQSVTVHSAGETNELPAASLNGSNGSAADDAPHDPRDTTRSGALTSGEQAPEAAHPSIAPFERIVVARDPALLVDEILPDGTLLECATVDALNCFINYVDLRSVITERDPEEDERYISISNQFYTHFHEFGTVIHVVASSARHWWYFCYDIDANDCVLGRVAHARATLPQFVEWVYQARVKKRYPVTEIDIRQLRGWRSFQ